MAFERFVIRCAEDYCKTSVDLEDDPAALCDDCGGVFCELDKPGHECEAA